MSDESFNLYDDEDNVITDESSEAEEIDDLMDVAVSSLKVPKVERVEIMVPKPKSMKKIMEKARLRLKRKYIAWANKKHHRERIVNYFLPGRDRRKYEEENEKDPALVDFIETDEECADYCAKENTASKSESNNIPTETIDLDDSDIEDENHDHDGNINNHNDDDDEDDDDDDDENEDEIEAMDVEEEENNSEKIKEKEKETNIEIKAIMIENLPKENAIKPVENEIQKLFVNLNEIATTSAQNSGKTTPRPKTPPLLKDKATNTIEIKQDENKNIFFNDELNRMYPKFDEIISKHVHSEQTLKSIKNKIDMITLDVGTINRKLEIRENEYNKLLYEKRIKEEILTRMLRKVKVLGMKKAPVKGKKYDLMALKEIEDAITKYTPHPSKKHKKELTVAELLNKGANMTKREIDIERASWGPVEEILKHLYPEEPEYNRELTNALPLTPGKHQRHLIMNQYSDNSNQFSDGLSLDDYEEPSQFKLLNRMMFKPEDFNESSEMDTHVAPYSSTLENLLNKSGVEPQQNSKRKSETHMLVTEGESQEDISVVPVCKETEYIPQTASNREQLVVRLESPSVKICQYCGIHEARFLCAACQNQWYCSRSCQVTAWKIHCETCE